MIAQSPRFFRDGYAGARYSDLGPPVVATPEGSSIMSQPNDTPADRTRTHPDERFAAPALAFDLNAAAEELAREATVNKQGHRQKTLYRHGQSSLALFLFEPGSELREHRTNGTVFIQILQGRLTVHAAGQRHALTAGHVLVMSPEVPHDLHAEERTHMLLTVSLQPPSPTLGTP
jgi:quercetin dioxygenase-like cupin family protein